MLHEFLHGWGLKSLSLAARLSFLLIIVPVLHDGDLGIYIFISSTALLVATFATFGLEEELPRSVAGDLSVAGRYFFWHYVLVVLNFLSLLIFLVYPTESSGVLVLSLTLMSMRFWGGLVRSIDVRINERQQNLPWVLFVAIAFILKIDNAFGLIATMVVASISVQGIGFFQIYLRRSKTYYVSTVSLSSVMKTSITYGSAKLFSNLMVMGASRASVLMPVWLGMGTNIDKFAFAIAAGEAVSQFGMIPVNRAYAKWCREKPETRREWRKALAGCSILWASLVGLSVLGVSILQFFELMPRQVPNTYLLLTAMVFFALIPSFRLVRYLLWARGLGDILISVSSLALCVSCALVIYLLPDNQWFVASTGILIFVLAIMAAVSRTTFLSRGSPT